MSDTRTDDQSNSYSESYFDTLYSGNSDPWQYQTRWYEQRKRDMCLAVLPQARYANAIELGCGNGVFSELLARRCQALLSIDGNNKAVQLAKQRLTDLAQVKVIQGIIPDVLSTLEQAQLQAYPLSEVSNGSSANMPPFDLIVISEILYYLSPEDIDKVIAWVGENLAKGGTLLCCHWRFPIKGFAMTGETVHQRFYKAFNRANTFDTVNITNPKQAAFTQQSQTVDSDFLLDVWQNSSKSVAMQESLV
jgi:SAM-dependent methyltransferase